MTWWSFINWISLFWLLFAVVEFLLILLLFSIVSNVGIKVKFWKRAQLSLLVFMRYFWLSNLSFFKTTTIGRGRLHQSLPTLFTIVLFPLYPNCLISPLNFLLLLLLFFIRLIFKLLLFTAWTFFFVFTLLDKIIFLTRELKWWRKLIH